MQNNQIHIDLETMDTKPSARILSIGAICGTREFYAEIDQSLYDDRFTESKGTKDWWAGQGGFIPTVTPQSPFEAVSALSTFISSVRNDVVSPVNNLEVWANSPSFDCTILSYHYHVFSIGQPWKFYEERDVRTVKAFATQMRLHLRPYKNPHHALEDARNQQMMVDSFYMTMAQKLQMANENAVQNCT